MPKVSVVVINYNYARYLDERIQSFLDQTYRDFELIIVDNGSTDNSVEIINRYTGDPRVKPHLYKDNKPPYYRWNEAADIAEGEYLLVASSDDSCSSIFLEKLVEKLDKHPSVGIAFSQSWDIDDQGKRLRSWKEWTDDLSQEHWAEDFINVGIHECQYLLFRNVIPCTSAVLLRRSIFMKAGKFDVRLKYLADWLLWVKMLLISDIAFIAEPLNNYRTHSSSTTSTTRLALELEERLQVIRYLAQEVQASPEAWQGVYNQTVGAWSRLIVYEKLPLRTSQKIYKILKNLDPNINYRLTRHCIKEFMHKMSMPFTSFHN